MRHIKKYEELDFSKLNPFSLFKGDGKPSSVDDIIKDHNLNTQSDWTLKNDKIPYHTSKLSYLYILLLFQAFFTI